MTQEAYDDYLEEINKKASNGQQVEETKNVDEKETKEQIDLKERQELEEIQFMEIVKTVPSMDDINAVQ